MGSAEKLFSHARCFTERRAVSGGRCYDVGGCIVTLLSGLDDRVAVAAPRRRHGDDWSGSPSLLFAESTRIKPKSILQQKEKRRHDNRSVNECVLKLFMLVCCCFDRTYMLVASVETHVVSMTVKGSIMN